MNIRNFIDGKWTDSTGGRKFVNLNPKRSLLQALFSALQ